MRQSGEAQCPNPKQVQDPTNTYYSIQEVFFNICGLVDGGILDQIKVCLRKLFCNVSETERILKYFRVARVFSLGKVIHTLCLMRLR